MLIETKTEIMASLQTSAYSSGPSERLEPSRVTSSKKMHLVAAKVFTGTMLGAPKGALIGYICGYGVGYGINMLLEELPGYTNDPQLAPLVAKVGSGTGAAIHAVIACMRSAFYSVDDRLSWREFLIKVLC